MKLPQRPGGTFDMIGWNITGAQGLTPPCFFHINSYSSVP